MTRTTAFRDVECGAREFEYWAVTEVGAITVAQVKIPDVEQFDVYQTLAAQNADA